MPHITVEYSAPLADAFDRPAFAKDLHETVVSVAGGNLAGCKTRFLPLDDTYIADGAPHHAMVHVQVAVLSGRTTGVKSEVSREVLALLRRHLTAPPELEVQLSAELRDLDSETYERHTEPRTAL